MIHDELTLNTLKAFADALIMCFVTALWCSVLSVQLDPGLGKRRETIMKFKLCVIYQGTRVC
ncbi:hypothetical protein BDY19DRAFT_959116 [Irpex rosettiformis]|uniref:Uncharacterized protein n=1 Tax=Irpex rosettiformis TaxID=378272 RepID=A0ACB8TXY0_9APHY|nr:hypothetical protein BDY19DRAFT_959116 [Irpex rosettiformis]